MNKSNIKTIRFDDLQFVPRFEYGEMAEVVEIVGCSDGTELGTGYCRFNHASIPWTIQYDEVITVIEGTMQVKTDDSSYTLGEKDSIWLPAGTSLVYESESALVMYAIHPSDWSSNATSEQV